MNNQNRSIYDNNADNSYEARLQKINVLKEEKKKKGNFHINMKLVLAVLLLLIFVGLSILLIPELTSDKKNETQNVSMKLITNNMSLKIGDEKKIEYNFIDLDNNNLPKVSFKTENSLVATVSEDGVVKAIGSGNTYIIITYNNGKENIEEKCKISVEGVENNTTNNNENKKNENDDNTTNNNNNTNNDNNNPRNNNNQNGMSKEEYEKMIEKERKKKEEEYSKMREEEIKKRMEEKYKQ